MEEIWRDIPGYENKYQASTYGRVKRLVLDSTRIKNGKEYNIQYKSKILKQSNHIRGYKNVCIGGTVYLVHILIAMTFPEICGEYYNGCIVHHINEDKKYNTPYNLRVLSKYEHYKEHTRIGMKNKKPIIQYTLNGEPVRYWGSTQECSNNTGFSKSCICNNLKGKCKTVYGYIFKYANPSPLSQ